jgi:hypothetical protein
VGLLRPLDFNQTAPPLFLVLTKMLVNVLGPAEWVFRLIPVAAALTTVLLLARLATRLLGTDVAAFTLWLAAFSPLALVYSNVFKQYSSDTLATVLLLSFALPVFEDPEPLRHWMALGAAGCVLLLFSQPAIFVAAGIVMAFVSQRNLRRGRLLVRCAVMSLAWTLFFAIVYATLYRPVASSPYMQRFWSNVISASLAYRGPRGVGELFGGDMLPLGLPGAIGLSLVVVGAVAIWIRRGTTITVLLTAPYAFLLAAFFLGKFPVYERLVLFMSPFLFLLIGAALATIVSGMYRRWQPFAAAIIPLACIVFFVINWPLWPTWSDNTRAVLKSRLQGGYAGEPVFIFPRSIPSWAFYTSDWSSNPRRYDWFVRAYRFGSLSFGDMPSRSAHPIENAAPPELSDLHRPEFLGLYSGVENTVPMINSEEPDPGWAAHEVMQLRQIAHPCVWLYSFQSRTGELIAIRGALKEAGAQVTVAAPLTQSPVALPGLERICWDSRK